MNSRYLWKFLLIAFVVAWSINELYPPLPRDLIAEFEAKAANPDTNFTAMVTQARKLQAAQPERVYANLWDAVGTNDLARYFPSYVKSQDDNPKRTILNRLQREAAGKIRLGIDLQGGTSFLVVVDVEKATADAAAEAAQGTNAAPALSEVERTARKQELLSQAVEVLRKRVDRFGVAEPVLLPIGESQILIQMPGLSEADKADVRETLMKVAHLEFRMVHPESDRYLSEGIVPPGYEVLREEVKQADGSKAFTRAVVRKGAEGGLNGKFVKSAMVALNPLTSEPEIHMNFDAEGAKIFADITTKFVGQRMGIVLDGELYSAPNIREPILGGRCQITGNYDLKEAYRLANALENPLEAPIKIEEERSVDPSLGKDSIESGVRASLYGVTGVAVFMAVYYLLSGLIANLALVLNIIILIGVMCSIDATFTMPGIAGIVLTIGMAVDANVLIFERMREELAAGKSLRGALSAGYDKAFSTIFDANVTTLISSVLLIYFGTGPVKGFGVTLTIGVAVSMFTALVVTRFVFDFLLSKNLLKSLPMLQLVKATRIDFLKLAKPAFIASWTLVLVGMGYGVFVRGHNVLGVDFAGGDSVSLGFTQKVEVGQVREALDKAGVGEVSIQYQKSPMGQSELLNVLTGVDKGLGVEKALQAAFPQSGFQQKGFDKVGPSVGQEIVKSAIIATLLSLLGILVYVALRYEFSFALGAVVAVLHDVFMTMGWFFLTDRQLSAPMVAAILTIIGFSINDTIVIFDRVREHLKLGSRGTFKDLMNQALNETLSRTIITSGTVFLSTLSLYLFGGGVINDFAFTFLVGILTGTYSSIYIAGAIVLWWHKGEKPKTTASTVVIESAQAAARA